jgi:hypothetical protein
MDVRHERAGNILRFENREEQNAKFLRENVQVLLFFKSLCTANHMLTPHLREMLTVQIKGL